MRIINQIFVSEYHNAELVPNFLDVLLWGVKWKNIFIHFSTNISDGSLHNLIAYPWCNKIELEVVHIVQIGESYCVFFDLFFSILSVGSN